MIYRLTKRFRFEMAHRLVKGYKGKCARLHGHSWNGELIVEVEGLDKQDMAIDFGRMGTIVKEWEARYDHRTMLHEADPLAGVLAANGDPAILIFANPTCETLAAALAREARMDIDTLLGERMDDLAGIPGRRAISVAVRIEETCTTSCTVQG